MSKKLRLKLPKSKEVIDADVDEDALLDRIWENDFVKSRVEKYQAIFCTFVPGSSTDDT
jgi:hypothetical protein